MSNVLNRHQRRALISRRNDPKTRALIDLLKKEGTRLDDHVYVTELEAENKRLNEDMQMVMGQVLPKIVEFPERYEAHTMAEELRVRVQNLERMRPEIDELPRDLLGVVDLIQKLYPDRVFFTEQARKSAEVASFQDIHISWRLLRSMATTLFDLFGTNCDLEKEYRDRSGFELALTETGATKDLSEATRQRMIRYGDRYLFGGAHIKYGTKSPRLLRVHFTYRTESPVIVVGHVGNHLETAGTRRGRGK